MTPAFRPRCAPNDDPAETLADVELASADIGRPWAAVTPDNLIDPEALAPIARTDLREALHVVRRAQRGVGAWSPPS